MSRAFKLPDLGEGVHEGEVLAVHVSVGQEVKEGDIILEVETDKAAVEIPSPFTGTVAEIMVKSGDTVKVGDVMMAFSNGEEAKVTEAPTPEEAHIESPEIAEAAPIAETGERKGPVPARTWSRICCSAASEVTASRRPSILKQNTPCSSKVSIFIA